MKECILSLSNFYVMDQDYQVLRNINLKLKSGETLAILGQDGSGTSAFINGLTGKSLALGQLFYKSKLVDFTLNNLRRHKIEIITDKPKLMENMSVSENLFLGTSRQKNLPIFYSNKKIAKISEIILEKYNLNLNPRTKVKELTLEEKKNLAFVRAFSCGANVVILYEPSENISLTSLRNLHSMIKMHKSEGKSVIYITKQWEDALRIADRIAILNEGEITEILSSNEVRNNPKNLIYKVLGINTSDTESNVTENQFIESVFEAVECLTSEYELNDLLNLLAENAAKAMKSDACEISLIDEETYVVIDKSIYKRNNSIEFIPNEAEILKLIDEERVYYFTKRDKGFERFFRLNNDICSLICVPFYICTY